MEVIDNFATAGYLAICLNVPLITGTLFLPTEFVNG